MRSLFRVAGAIVLVLVLVPSVARAQASITGVVKDGSGAVLPGVTVEASSPALIENSAPLSLTAADSTASKTCGPGPTSSPSS